MILQKKEFVNSSFYLYNKFEDNKSFACGKKAIHLGGPLQLLFGIKGGRWDNGDIGKVFYNEYWTRPLLEETPEKFKNIEGGCYW